MGGVEVKTSVTATISTRDRYFTTLPIAIMSIANQTVAPDRLVIYDDGEQQDLRRIPVYSNLFSILTNKGIDWSVEFGKRQGQVKNHQKALDDAKTEWIWRLDDDNAPEANVLEQLLSNIDDSVGAVGGLVFHPNGAIKHNKIASNMIEDVGLMMNAQWFKQDKKLEVDHLYSTFIYRVKAGSHGYCKELSQVGHHEETIFTYEIKRSGYKVIIDPKAITWHLREGTGGIRSYNDTSLWERDSVIFKKKLEGWGIKPAQYKFVVLDNGLGDHLAFKRLLPDIKQRYADHNIIIACCYNEVFRKDKDIKLISVADAKNIFDDLDKWNVYKHMWDNTHKHWTLEEGYRSLYDC
jgi:GT2 family glycosyltransferase